MDKIEFRKDFLFGVATASTQIEGGDKGNMWYEWTKNGDKTLVCGFKIAVTMVISCF